MIYLKSVLAGVVTLIASIVLFFILISIVLFVWSNKVGGDSSIGFDPISLMKPPWWLVLAGLIFASGFYWEFRRLVR